MFGLGLGELVVILFIILLLFGAKNLPEMARAMGKAVRGFKDAAHGLDQNEPAQSDENLNQKGPG